MKTCYIFGAAEGFPTSLCKTDGDIVIAADGGYTALAKLGVKPDIVLGDFDSLGYVPEFSGKIIKHPVKKDDTDTMLAVKTAIDLGFERIVIYGGTGKRLDHTLANIQTLSFAAVRGCKAYLCGDGYTLTVVTDSVISFKSTAKGNVSVFSCVAKSQGVYEKGLLYNLENAELDFDFPLGVSNEFVGTESEISVKKGSIAVFWSGDLDDLLE